MHTQKTVTTAIYLGVELLEVSLTGCDTVYQPLIGVLQQEQV